MPNPETGNLTENKATGGQSNAETMLVSKTSIAPPDPLNFRQPETWTAWITWFERYISVANLLQRSPKDKVGLLIIRLHIFYPHIEPVF